MRAFVTVMTTSVLTALAVHVVDASAGGTTVEASQFVVRDAQGNVRVSIDEHGMAVIDASDRTRIGVRVEDGATSGASSGRARIFVTPATDVDGNPYAWESVEMTDGVSGTDRQRRFDPRITVYREPLLNGGDKSVAAGTTIGAGRVALSDGTNHVDRVTLAADDKAVVVRDRNGRVRFRK